MTSHRAAEFFKAVQQDQALQARLQAVSDPKAFIQIAADRGYTFSEEELEQAVEQLPDAELASMLNPGVGSRERLVPR